MGYVFIMTTQVLAYMQLKVKIQKNTSALLEEVVPKIHKLDL